MIGFCTLVAISLSRELVLALNDSARCANRTDVDQADVSCSIPRAAAASRFLAAAAAVFECAKKKKKKKKRKQGGRGEGKQGPDRASV